jgi:hypothetical protein
VPQSREERLAKRRAQYAANPAPHRQRQQAYAQQYPDRVKKRKQRWNKANRAHNQALQQLWRENNREHVNALQRIRYPSHAEKSRADALIYAASHREEAKAKSSAWAKTHPERVRQNLKIRRARKLNAPISDLTHEQWLEIQAAQDHRCYYCGKRCKGRLTQDHIMPLTKGGSHTLHNVIGACHSCNVRKHVGPPPVPVQPLLLTIAPARKKKKAS